MTKRNEPAVAELQAAAVAWVRTYVSGNSFELPSGMSEQAFGQTMDAILRAMMLAWAAGYAKARKG